MSHHVPAASRSEERTASDLVEANAEITKDALRIIASAAPTPIADNEIVRRLTELGYRATDVSRDVTLAGLDGLAQATDGTLVRRVGEGGARAAYEMNAKVAKQLLKSLLGE